MKVTVHSNDDSLNWGATGDERIVQNVRNILRTRPYEVPFMRDLGVNPDYITAAPRQIKTEFTSHVADVIKAHEPRANVLSVEVESFDENGNYVIAVELEV